MTRRKTTRVIAMICVMMVLTSVLSLSSFALTPMQEINQFRMLFDSKVREGKGITYDHMGTASEGTIQLGINSSASYSYGGTSNAASNWTGINWNSGTGYVRNDLFCPESFLYEVTASSLRVRETASTSSDTLCTIASGIHVERLNSNVYTDDSGTSFFKVRVRQGSNEGTIGYAAKAYLNAGY